ncbi:hypothetical protein [Nonomuraea sp. NPDC050202]|jgi:hypothetical protein
MLVIKRLLGAALIGCVLCAGAVLWAQAAQADAIHTEPPTNWTPD